MTARTWIIQEILLARRVSLLSGTKSLEWEVFMTAIEPIISLRTLFGDWQDMIDDASPVAQVSRSWLEKLDGTLLDSIMPLVGRFASSHCTIQHDRVYAILGLASDASSCVVDYNMPFSVFLFYLISKYAYKLDHLIYFYRAFDISDKSFLEMLRPRNVQATGLDSADTSGQHLTRCLGLRSIL